MSAYLVAMVRVDDAETYKRYTARTPELIEKRGGRFLIRGGAIETIECPEFKDRLVLVEFPSKDAMKKFYESPEYQEIKEFRAASSEATFLLAKGARASRPTRRWSRQAERKARVVLCDSGRPGPESPAALVMLSPSVGCWER